MTLILLRTGDILLLVGMHKDPSLLAGEVMPYFLVGIYMNCMFYTFRMYLTCLENSLVPMLIQAFCIALHPLWLWMLTAQVDVGVNGCFIA